MRVKESIIFGLIVLVIGNISGFFIGRSFSVDLPAVCKKWNKNHIMEITLFITGMISFLLYDIIPKNYLK